MVGNILTFTCIVRGGGEYTYIYLYCLALAQDEILGEVWYNIGHIALGIGDVNLAFQCFRSVLKRMPDLFCFINKSLLPVKACFPSTEEIQSLSQIFIFIFLQSNDVNL